MVTPDPHDDGLLVARVLSGETDAFAELAARYQGPLFRVARSRLGREDWAEDVVQEAFLACFRSLHTYDSRFSFRTWLWTILLNQCRRHWKQRSRTLVRSWEEGDGALQAELAENLRDEVRPSERLVARERAELLDRMLARLPDAQADALRLRFFGGLKFHEIARTMNCSLSTAKNRVRWGLTRMAEFLGPEGGEAASWPAERDACGP